MCSIYGVFDFKGDAGVNHLLREFKAGNMYVTQHAVLLNENYGPDVSVAVESVLGNIYTVVVMGKNGKEHTSSLLNCYLEKRAPLLKGRISFFIYDETKKRVCVARLKNSRKKIFYSVSDDRLQISSQTGKFSSGQKVFSLKRGAGFVYDERGIGPKIIDF